MTAIVDFLQTLFFYEHLLTLLNNMISLYHVELL